MGEIDFAPFRENKYEHIFPQKKIRGVLIIIKKNCKHRQSKIKIKLTLTKYEFSRI